MAMSGEANVKLNEMLVCPVCLDTYREARTLACLHSFCTECLEGCLRVLRREIECPVCKRVTNLANAGVRGLPADYRIEQIRDFIAAGSQSVASVCTEKTLTHICDVCKSQERSIAASQHCVQCLMQLCHGCLQRHNANPILSVHQVISVGDNDAAASLFCLVHRQQPIRYFCAQCRITLCTICTIEHDPSHKPESLETGIINKYRCRLSEALSALASRLAEVKTRSKRLGALRQSRQNDLYIVQQNVRERTAQIIEHIKQREAFLLADAQSKFDSGLSAVHGSDTLTELDFLRLELEQLVNEIRLLLGGPPHSCLSVFDAIMARVSRLTESALSALPTVRYHSSKSMCFVPAPDSELDLMVGCLQECSFSGTTAEDNMKVDDNESPSTTSSPSRSNVCTSPMLATTSQSPPSAVLNEFISSTRKRTASILGALSPPTRKSDMKLGRIKGITRSNSSATWREKCQSNSSPGDAWRDNITGTWRDKTSQSMQSSSPSWQEISWRDGPHSARHINFEIGISSSTSSSRCSDSPMMPQSSVTSPSSPVSTSVSPAISSPAQSSSSLLGSSTTRILFKVDQVGGLQGMIQCPVAVSFVADGHVLVAEYDRRVQLFDNNGRSVRVIGWGNIQPLAVAVGPDGLIAVAEKTSQTIRFYMDDGRDADSTRRWSERMFGMPCSVAVAKTTGHVVVADCDRRSVTVHSPGGAVLSRIGSDQLGNPTHVAVTEDGARIYVSDALHACVKVFDSAGQYIRQLVLPQTNSSCTVRPHGMCVSKGGHLYVCDRDGHRILLFNVDGQFIGDLFHNVDSSHLVKYPCDVAVSQSVDVSGNTCTLVAVTESCSGLLDNDRHHAVKLYAL